MFSWPVQRIELGRDGNIYPSIFRSILFSIVAEKRLARAAADCFDILIFKTILNKNVSDALCAFF